MKLILIIQSFIIFAGVGYWYVVLRTDAEVPADVPVLLPVSTEVSLPNQDESISEPPEEFIYSTSSIQYDAEGHTDAGMEFPVADDIELQL